MSRQQFKFRSSNTFLGLRFLLVKSEGRKWIMSRFLSVLVVVVVLVAQGCPILCNPTDCSPPGSSVHEILQARILEWVVIPFSRGSSQPWGQTWVSCITGRFFTIWATNFQYGKPVKWEVFWWFSETLAVLTVFEDQSFFFFLTLEISQWIQANLLQPSQKLHVKLRNLITREWEEGSIITFQFWNWQEKLLESPGEKRYLWT